MTMKQSYSTEFRAEAVKLVLEQGLSQREASSRLGIPKGTLANWVVAAKSGSDKPAPGARTVSELETENARLRKELAEARQERDIVKKAAAYFARESAPTAKAAARVRRKPSWPTKQTRDQDLARRHRRIVRCPRTLPKLSELSEF